MHDTTIALWEKHYRITVPFILSLEDEQIEIQGVRVTGDRQMDSELKDQWIARYATVNDMVKFFRRGVHVRVATKDTKTIYDDIVLHIDACKNILETGLNYDDPELLQDLMDLDEFARSIYEHAKWQFDPSDISDQLYKAMSGLTRFNKTNILGYRLRQDSQEQSSSGITYINGGHVHEIPEHQDSGEFLRNKLASLGAF